MELETIFFDGVPVSDIVNLCDKEGNRVMGIAEQNIFKGKTYQIAKNNDIYIGALRLKSEEESAEMSNRIHIANYIRHGYGILHFAEGGVFEGNFENNQIQGEGKFIYKDGSIYQGNLMNGLKSNQGQITFINGDSYEGEWKSDQKHGKGIYKYANGDYHGEFVKGIKHGKGLLVYPNGDTYKGEFKDNKMHGCGLLVSNKGEEINGKWSNGMLVSDLSSNKDKNCVVF